MERLTTDNPRNNTEVALNLVYVKDGQAWVRNGGPAPGYPDVTLYDYMRLIVADHGPMSIKAGLTDDELGDALDDALFDGIETKEGLCAMLYTLAWAFAELRQRLAAYEDTGLTPEGMEAIKTSLMGKSLAEIKEINGLPVERMIELAEAEHDGRLVVLETAPRDSYKGLTRKYIVFKSDSGEPVENCFVLRPDKDLAAKIALEAYAKTTDNKTLADDIARWIGDSGKVLVLPCKEGTPIWKLSPRLNSAPVIEERYYSVTFDRHLQLGKNLFLSRDEAEKALEGMEV